MTGHGPRRRRPPVVFPPAHGGRPASRLRGRAQGGRVESMPIGLTQTPTMGRWQAGKFLAGTLTIPHEAPSISGRCLLQPDRHGILYRYSVCRKATLYPPTLFVTVASLGDSRVSLILSVATSPSFRRCYSHNESKPPCISIEDPPLLTVASGDGRRRFSCHREESRVAPDPERHATVDVGCFEAGGRRKPGVRLAGHPAPQSANGSCIKMVSSRSGLVDNRVTGAPISSSTRRMYLMAVAGSRPQDRAPRVLWRQPSKLS